MLSSPSKSAFISAFSLVELSIVLVILGLLAGGILTGQSLIRAAELRSVTIEFQAFQTAINTFKDKYFSLPGDMTNATDFWGQMTNCGAANPSGSGTCNGDGNSFINSTPTAAARTGERFMIWNHLANAELIEGEYTGIAGALNRADAIAGVNVPASRLANGAWFSSYWGISPGQTMMFDGDYGNGITIGGVLTGNQPYNPLISPEEAWKIDTKIDDGLPAQGKVTARNRVNCSIKSDGSAQTTAAADAADLNSTYNLPLSGNQCALLFGKTF